MVSILLSVFIFWIWPARDLNKVKAVKGIGLNEEAKLDQATVEGWKAGRIRAKKLWLGFGSLVVFGSMLNFVVNTFWGEGGIAPDLQLEQTLSWVTLGAVGIGLLGFLGGLIYSACNNQKYLGQLRVRM